MDDALIVRRKVYIGTGGNKKCGFPVLRTEGGAGVTEPVGYNTFLWEKGRGLVEHKRGYRAEVMILYIENITIE